MSVILDALHKARGDKRDNQDEPQPNSVARVLDANVTPPHNPDLMAGSRRPSKSNNWFIAVVAMLGLFCLLTLVGGAFFLLYRMQRLELQAHAKDELAIKPQADRLLASPPAGIATAPVAYRCRYRGIAGAAPLPTPLPLSELPVQPPIAGAGQAGAHNETPPMAATGAVGTKSAPVAAPTAAPPQFKLGSIVCENKDCIASLNGRSVRVGDEIRNYRVTQITATGISLKSMAGDDVVSLSLY